MNNPDAHRRLMDLLAGWSSGAAAGAYSKAPSPEGQALAKALTKESARARELQARVCQSAMSEEQVVACLAGEVTKLVVGPDE